MPRPQSLVCRVSGCPKPQPCSEHDKPWRTSRRQRLAPKSGRALQAENARLLEIHAGICHVCRLPGATRVDHVIPVAEGGSDSDENKRPIHEVPCHREKTAEEARRARRRAR